MHNHDHSPDCVHPDDLSPLLIQVLQDNREQVMGWLRKESGCWGLLVKKAAVSRQEQRGHPLSDADLKLVQDRLWWLLDSLKRRVAE